MGDRTSVTLTVLASQAELAKTLFKEDVDDCKDDPLLTDFYFEDVNYGVLDFLDDLEAAGIAYDSSWSNGGEYSSGTRFCRFTKTGELVSKELYDNARDVSLTLLLEFVDTPEKMKQVVLDHAEKVSIPSWDNQEEYSKLYRMRKLITPV